MKIKWIGHSCFKVEKNGYSVIFDPYGDGSVPGLGPVRDQANQVLCSHEHGDHNGREGVTILPEEECPFRITRIEGFHDDKKGMLRGKNVMTILDDGEERLAHLGDIGCDLDKNQEMQLQNLDVLLIPVGGFFTINAGKAAEIVKKLQPKKVVPMHFRGDKKNFGFKVIGKVASFTKEFPDAVYLEDCRMDSGQDYGGQVIVLQPEMAQ